MRLSGLSANVAIFDAYAEMDTDEWVNEMKMIKTGCSKVSQQIMLQICKDIAYLDRKAL